MTSGTTAGARRGRRARRLALGTAVASLAVAAAMAATPGRFARLARVTHGGVPRSVLWDVVVACRLDAAVTGHPFPCAEVVADAPGAPGHVVLRAPFADTHLVVVPTARVPGVEAVAGPGGAGAGYLRAAWAERGAVSDATGGRVPPAGVGVAVNSALTRSQDQLHLHVDCVRAAVATALAARAGDLPADRWAEAGLVVGRHPMWARIVAADDLATLDPFGLAAEVPDVARDPGRATLAMVPTRRDGRDALALLVAPSDPALDAGQFTAEHLLDHACGARPDAGWWGSEGRRRHGGR